MSSIRLSIGSVLFCVPIAIACFELSPAWSLYHLPWPVWCWYATVTAGGLVGGAILAGRTLLAGALAGAVAAASATFALDYVLDRSSGTNTAMFMIVGGLGALPGVVLFKLLTARDR